MKKNLYILLALILVASFTIAAGGHGVRIKGVITAIDADAMTITVNSTVVQVTHSTYIEECDGNEDHTTITFGELEIEDRVGVTGQFDGDILVAKKIVVH